MAYVFLLLAIGWEVLATSLLKSTEGFTRLWPSLACLGAYAISFAMLARIVTYVPVGVVYAMWSGLGTTAVMAIAAVYLHEPITATKVVGAALIVGGVVILNLGSAH